MGSELYNSNTREEVNSECQAADSNPYVNPYATWYNVTIVKVPKNTTTID